MSTTTIHALRPRLATTSVAEPLLPKKHACTLPPKAFAVAAGSSEAKGEKQTKRATAILRVEKASSRLGKYKKSAEAYQAMKVDESVKQAKNDGALDLADKEKAFNALPKERDDGSGTASSAAVPLSCGTAKRSSSPLVAAAAAKKCRTVVKPQALEDSSSSDASSSQAVKKQKAAKGNKKLVKSADSSDDEPMLLHSKASSGDDSSDADEEGHAGGGHNDDDDEQEEEAGEEEDSSDDDEEEEGGHGKNCFRALKFPEQEQIRMGVTRFLLICGSFLTAFHYVDVNDVCAATIHDLLQTLGTAKERSKIVSAYRYHLRNTAGNFFKTAICRAHRLPATYNFVLDGNGYYLKFQGALRALSRQFAKPGAPDLMNAAISLTYYTRKSYEARNQKEVYQQLQRQIQQLERQGVNLKLPKAIMATKDFSWDDQVAKVRNRINEEITERRHGARGVPVPRH